jgi:phospholipid/cholesterol/gamma-HCH transport system substrate-binding protein
METKAPYVVIGIFTVVVVGGIMAFVHWAVSYRLPDARTRIYTIDFQGSVAGLNPTGEVYFNGIKVGQVERIDFVPEEPRKVRVQVKIAANTPLRSDAVASLEYQGITGVTVIQIEGGRPDSPPLEAEPGQPWPRISSRESRLRELLHQAPELLHQATQLMQHALEVLSPGNIALVSRTLDHLEQFTGNLAAQKEAIPDMIKQLNAVGEQLLAISHRLETIAARAEGVLGSAQTAITATQRTVVQAGTFIHQDLSHATHEITKLAESIDTIIQTAGPGIVRFSNEGLLSLSQLIKEARLLLGTLDRVGHRLESDPERFLFGDQVPEVELP